MLTLNEALSTTGINAMIEATEIGKEKLGENFYSSCVTRLLKNGYWADITDKEGNTYKLRIKKDGKLTIINFK